MATALAPALILQGSPDELRDVQPPALVEAEDALRQAEETGSERAVETFVSLSLGWIRDAAATLFANLQSPEPLAQSLAILVDQAVLEAPFTTWRHLYGERFLVLALADHLRTVAAQCGVPVAPLLPEGCPPTPPLDTAPRRADLPTADVRIPPSAVDLKCVADLASASAAGSPASRGRAEPRRRIPQSALFRLIANELARRQAQTTPIDEICDSFDVSLAHCARLFGVSRQAAQQWRDGGVPPARVADVERVRELATMLRRRLRPGRAPQVVRTRARGLGGRSVLDVLEAEGAEPVYRYLYDLFSYRGALREAAAPSGSPDASQIPHRAAVASAARGAATGERGGG